MIDLQKRIKTEFNAHDDPYHALNQIMETVAEASPVTENPVSTVKWVSLDKIRANDYNPNEVADEEMELLFKSIDEDGYTQPVVTVYDEEQDEYEIIDGFHRYMVMKRFREIADPSDGHLPVTVIDKSLADRMASTIRHNRARGKHSVKGLGKVVFEMKEEGLSDKEICQELGMEPDELARLKHISGFSKLFEDTEYGDAWKTDKQLEIEQEEE